MKQKIPVELGKEYDVKIRSLGSKGDGIGKCKDFVIIVPNTNVGETVRVKITRVLPSMAFAEKNK